MAVEELDEALERFQIGQCEYGGGLSNHGPMAAEALIALGHRALVPALVERYAPRLGAAVLEGRPLPEADWESALSDYDRLGDWIATFQARLEDGRPFGAVVAEAVALLADGLIGAAAHGWLRTAHAARALEDHDTPVRRKELAVGLGYWAARYARLPGVAGSHAVPGRGPGEAIGAVVPVPPERRRGVLFTEQLTALDDDAAWRDTVESVDLDRFDADPGGWIAELCRTMAALYLRHPAARIAYVHTVTAPSALRLVLAHLDRRTARRAAGAAFQAAAALHAVAATGAGPPDPDPEVEALADSTAEIRYRAACSLEEHAIKMAEACVREDRVAPDPVLRRAAADAALRLESQGGRVC